MLIQAFSFLALLVFVIKTFKVSEKFVIIFLIVTFSSHFIYLKLIDEQVDLFHQFIIFLTVLLTSPVFFISPPTLVIIREAKKKISFDYSEIACIVEKNDSDNNALQLTKSNFLVKDNQYTLIGNLIKFLINCLRHD